jgi:hypothetical protein
MKKLFLPLLLAANIAGFSQTTRPAIAASDVLRIENVLASDAMRGRQAGTPDIDRAADFLADEFRKAGLSYFSGDSYLQHFSLVKPRLIELKYKADGEEVPMRNIIVITSQPQLNIDEKSGYEVEQVKATENLFSKAQEAIREKKNIIVYVDPGMESSFSRLTFLKLQLFKSPYNTVFILGSTPKQFKIRATHSVEETRFTNVVGIIPGKSKKDEFVIFSGHYDHLGVGRPVNGDSIYNGANDDAAGTTAVIELANYFHKQNNNERTMVFAAFTAEEIGGYGSQYFSQQFDPKKIIAMFNIEMIGTESKWGKNSAYITGYEKDNMGEILQRNLNGTGFTFYPDPYLSKNLFYRSDNATLARLGVPAHTITTARMEGEPNYHKPSDEVSTLDIENMAQIMNAIAQSSTSIIMGKDTPSRVKTEDVQ